MSAQHPGGSTAVRVDALDGLRTLAVFLVIAFHVGVPGLAGGFLGVDVFFVLSGFLITTLLLKDLSARGRIDLGRFWARRFLRLTPAALVVIGTVLLWALLFAEPSRRAQIGADALWSILYVGNWRFIDSASYFDDDGTTSPLLHVWSLAVEEQFYIAWPLVLALTATLALRAARRRQVLDSADRIDRERLRRRTVVRATAWTSLGVGTVSAILLWVLYDPAAPDRAYMGTDAKVFEPLLGAFFAAVMSRRRAVTWAARHAGSLMIVGLAGITAGVVLLGGPAPLYFAGGALVFSLCVAALVVGVTVAGDRHPVSRLLAARPVAYLGRISYGLYLWHWPLAVWLLPPGGFRPVTAAAVVALTVACASLSYHLVEVPIRSGGLGRIAPVRLAPIGAGALVAAVLATAAVGGPLARLVPASPGASGSATDPQSVVVVGDSVMRRLSPGLATEAAKRGLTVHVGARGGCPGLTVPAVDAEGDLLADGRCTDDIRAVQDAAIEQARPATVIWWSRYEISDRLGDDGTLLHAGTPAFWAAQRASLHADIDRLTRTGATLVIVQTDRPGVGLASRCDGADCHPFLDRLWHRDELRREWNDLVAGVARDDPRVETIRMDDAYCRDADVPCDDRMPLPTPHTLSPADLSTPGPAPTPRPTVSVEEFGGTFEELARPDGSHFSDAAAAPVSNVLLDRVSAVTGGLVAAR